MARSDPIVRQWYLLRKIESPGGATLSELINAVPSDYPRHPRTIRRDLESLELFFPIYTERINGQTRWRFADGYRNLPALSFSPSELMAMIFSRDLLKPLEGTEIQMSLEAAFNKAAAILPPEGMAHVRKMQRYFSVSLGPHKNYREHKKTIEILSRALAEKRSIQMRYYSASSDATGRREVDPYRIWYASGALYLVGYCHKRRDVRLFAVDRIKSLTITDHAWQMPLGFDLDSYVQEALVVMRGNPIEVELLFDRKTAAWAKDRLWHPSQKLKHLKDGRMQMKLRVSDTPELIGWILSFGAGVRVVDPKSLRKKIIEEAGKILDML
ncbi:MAG: WYL domain-containing protein [Acidobacteria bacterium]|nr:WYL domain-containing protein [Acidobacteriota bacterium]